MFRPFRQRIRFFMVIREILFSPCFFSTIEKLFPPFSPPPPESNIAIKDKRKSRVARYYSKTILRFLPSPLSSPISVSLETTQHPPPPFPPIYFFYRNSLLSLHWNRKEDVYSRFLTPRTASNQQQIYRFNFYDFANFSSAMILSPVG